MNNLRTTLRVVPQPSPGPSHVAPTPTPEVLVRELVSATLRGDMRAWGKLYEGNFERVYRHICYLTGDPTASEDLVQDTFAKALASLARFEGRSAFSTWLHGIAVNVVRKHRDKTVRAARGQERVAEVHAAIPQGDELERRHIQKKRAAALYAALERLPQHLRDAFVLRDLEGLSVPEAALQLGVSEPNLRVRAHRARGRIHDELVAAGWLDANGDAR